jgi:hypothetical protein
VFVSQVTSGSQADLQGLKVGIFLRSQHAHKLRCIHIYIHVQWNLSKSDTPSDQGNVSDCTACQKTQVLF